MGSIEEMNRRICDLRQALQELIKQKKDLVDPLVVAASQELDVVLNEYNSLLRELNK